MLSIDFLLLRHISRRIYQLYQVWFRVKPCCVVAPPYPGDMLGRQVGRGQGRGEGGDGVQGGGGQAGGEAAWGTLNTIP